MRVLIKYATKNRPELFEKAIKNIHDTISGEHEYQIHVTMDMEDYVENNKIYKIKTDCSNYCHEGKFKLHLNDSLSKIHAINRDMAEITASFDWDLLVVMSDDMKFIQKDWDKRFVEEALKHPDHLLHFSDGYVKDALPTLCVMDRTYYERFHYIYPPCYKSFSCDAEQMFVAQMLGRWKYFDEVLFRHEHPANNKSVLIDKTYTDADEFQKEDTIVYFKRLKRLFNVNNPTYIPELMKPWL